MSGNEYVIGLGPVTVGIRTTEQGLLDYLRGFYEVTPTAETTETPETTDSVTGRPPPAWWIEARLGDPVAGMARTRWGVGYAATGGGRALVVAPDPRNLAITVRKMAREVLVEYCETRGATMLHASAVTDGRRVVIVVGDKGAGKTTLALSAVLGSGWTLLSNDHLLLYRDTTPERDRNDDRDRDSDGDSDVHGGRDGAGLVATSLPTPIPVKVGTWGDWRAQLGAAWDVEGIDPSAAAAMTAAQRYRAPGRFLYTYRGLGQPNPVHTRLPGRDVVVVLAGYAPDAQAGIPLVGMPEPVADTFALGEHVRFDWWFDENCNTRLLPRDDPRSRARFTCDSASRLVELAGLARTVRWSHRGRLAPLLDALDTTPGSLGPAGPQVRR